MIPEPLTLGRLRSRYQDDSTQLRQSFDRNGDGSAVIRRRLADRRNPVAAARHSSFCSAQDSALRRRRCDSCPLRARRVLRERQCTGEDRGQRSGHDSQDEFAARDLEDAIKQMPQAPGGDSKQLPIASCTPPGIRRGQDADGARSSCV